MANGHSWHLSAGFRLGSGCGGSFKVFRRALVKGAGLDLPLVLLKETASGAVCALNQECMPAA
jgi:hypothetical protein